MDHGLWTWNDARKRARNPFGRLFNGVAANFVPTFHACVSLTGQREQAED
jgi:hypothetical protein